MGRVRIEVFLPCPLTTGVPAVRSASTHSRYAADRG